MEPWRSAVGVASPASTSAASSCHFPSDSTSLREKLDGAHVNRMYGPNSATRKEHMYGPNSASRKEHLYGPNSVTREGHFDGPNSVGREGHFDGLNSVSREGHFDGSNSVSRQDHLDEPSSATRQGHLYGPDSVTRDDHLDQPSSVPREGNLYGPNSISEDVIGAPEDHRDGASSKSDLSDAPADYLENAPTKSDRNSLPKDRDDKAASSVSGRQKDGPASAGVKGHTPAALFKPKKNPEQGPLAHLNISVGVNGLSLPQSRRARFRKTDSPPRENRNKPKDYGIEGDLFKAVIRDDLAAVTAMLPLCENKSPRNPADLDSLGKGATPLHLAAQRGFTDVSKKLIAGGASVNMPTLRGLTPLHCAAQGGHVQVVKLLVEHGAQTSQRTLGGATALELATKCGDVKARKRLAHALKDGNPYGPFPKRHRKMQRQEVALHKAPFASLAHVPFWFSQSDTKKQNSLGANVQRRAV